MRNLRGASSPPRLVQPVGCEGKLHAAHAYSWGVGVSVGGGGYPCAIFSCINTRTSTPTPLLLPPPPPSSLSRPTVSVPSARHATRGCRSAAPSSAHAPQSAYRGSTRAYTHTYTYVHTYTVNSQQLCLKTASTHCTCSETRRCSAALGHVLSARVGTTKLKSEGGGLEGQENIATSKQPVLQIILDPRSGERSAGFVAAPVAARQQNIICDAN